jgi:hypothetical protein
MAEAEILLESVDLRNRIHAMNTFIDSRHSDKSICMRKIFSYTLLAELRKRHIEIIDSY